MLLATAMTSSRADNDRDPDHGRGGQSRELRHGRGARHSQRLSRGDDPSVDATDNHDSREDHEAPPEAATEAVPPPPADDGQPVILEPATLEPATADAAHEVSMLDAGPSEAAPVPPPQEYESRSPQAAVPKSNGNAAAAPIDEALVTAETGDADLAMADAQDATMATASVAAAPVVQEGSASNGVMSQTQQEHSGQQPLLQNSTEQLPPPSTPYTPSTMPNLDQQAYMMMALATMSAAPAPAMSPPPTVTPSQVTLPGALNHDYGSLPPSNMLPHAGPDKALESFARIEFADSVFQMTTYAVIVGRDQRALMQARRDEKRIEEHRRRVEENASKGLPPPSPIAPDRSKFSKSYVSEEGGMLGPESDSEEGRPAKRRKTSTTGSSNQENEESQDNMISERQYVSHTPGAAAVDLTSLRPSPWHVPFIGIHSPGPNIATKTKAISREHLKIAYNQDEGVFEAIPLHKNGFFCEDVHYKSDKVVLRSGDRLQIKDVDFRFMINGVERGRTGAEEYVEEDAVRRRHTHGGKEMSFDFENSHGDGELHETSDELSDLEASTPPAPYFGDYDDDSHAHDGLTGSAMAKVEPSVEQGAESMMPQIPKKRGPGRPPKNGVMSKREQRLLKKQQQELAKKNLPEAPPLEPPVKRKVGRPRKHPLPEDGSERPEKRKYKPRKPKNEDGTEVSDTERRAKEKKDKKVRPKSPPLELNIEDYTEEQLQKPNKNYSVLIDEALATASPDGLTLKQIYKRICQRYPYFYFHTGTKGWESSVRHNLIGNEAFRKDEVTHLWSRVPGVELDAGKKRKVTPPDRGLAAQGYGPYSYPYNAQQMPSGAHSFAPNQAPPGYQVPAFNAQQGQPAGPSPMQPYANSAAPAGQPARPLASQPSSSAQMHGYGTLPPPAQAQAGPPPAGAYSSPYAPRPPPIGAVAIKSEDGGASAQPLAAAPGAAPKSAAGPAMAPQRGPSAGVPASASPPANAPLRPVVDPRLLSAVVGLKNGLIENLKKARNPKAEGIVMSALNRCVGLKKDATENDKMEAICIKGIRQVIDGFTKTKSPTPGGSAQPDAPPPIFEAKVLSSLNGFKDVSIKALKARLGEARAEAVTLSSIDRVLGLADASIVPPAAEGESSNNLEGVELHLMKSIRQLLLGMNQKLQGPE